MKIRMGFVGNSSSSSFLIGAVAIRNLNEIVKSKTGKSGTLRLKKLHWDRAKKGGCLMDLHEWSDIHYEMCGGGDAARVYLEAFDHTSVIIEVSIADSHILFIDYTGDEGDSAFSIYDSVTQEWMEYDYNIDMSFFDGMEDVQEALKVFNGVDFGNRNESKDIICGAGRNG